MTYRISRRKFLASASGLALLPTLGGWPAAARAAGTPLSGVVGSWGGDYLKLLQQNVDAPLLRPQGCTVNYSVADQFARKTQMVAERMRHRGSMDVSLLGDIDMYDAEMAGTLVDVDPHAVPNYANVIDTLRHPYAVPHIFSAQVIVYNPALVKTRPDSYQAALDPRNKGLVGFSDILSRNNMMAGALAGGGKPEDLAAAKKFYLQLKPLRPRIYPSNETVAAALHSGEIGMTFMWKARALQWRNAGLPVEFAFPREGAVPYISEAAQLKNARSPAFAAAYMNALLAPSAQVAFAKTMGYAPTVTNAGLPPDLQQQVGFTDAEMKLLVKLDYAALSKQQAAADAFWNEDFKAGL
ncbi:ABC transporter substrate-binding protein [Burkholderia sp. WAC0059]|uniref:extracellular solute-binding protein n=1 Tax=Burkholderia sp. WAC0059 TaxID=2066022 RepID=UPI000C7F1211|nr:extracellular solute-binding protein [Burkholderia sp. WAC0059]PLZ02377.1 ABC transporter substrate-binding protein [Burkholderia sp. WAC0059]